VTQTQAYKTPLRVLMESAGLDPDSVLPEFRPAAVYLDNLDWLIVLFEDCSYRSRPSDVPSIELLMHQSEERLVGVKVLGFSGLVLGTMPSESGEDLRLTLRRLEHTDRPPDCN